jgi:putative sterol carrier protein
MTPGEFLNKLPSKVDPSVIEGMETRFHFDLDGENGGQYTVEVADGKVSVAEGLNGDPKCVVRSSSENFIDLATGKLNPMMAVFTGKVKISNPGEMLKYAKILGLM